MTYISTWHRLRITYEHSGVVLGVLSWGSTCAGLTRFTSDGCCGIFRYKANRSASSTLALCGWSPSGVLTPGALLFRRLCSHVAIPRTSSDLRSVLPPRRQLALLRGQSGVVCRGYPERAHISQTSFHARDTSTCSVPRESDSRFPAGTCLRRWISESETSQEVGLVSERDLTPATITRQ